MTTREHQEQAYAPVDHHVAKLINAIGEICTTFNITENDLIDGCEEAHDAIKEAEHFLDPQPVTVFLTVVIRNGRPINAFRDQQKAINFIIRTTTTNAQTIRIETRVAMKPTDDLLSAEFKRGFWYFEPHDDDRTYENALLLVPVV